jgi:hypothetical protein
MNTEYKMDWYDYNKELWIHPSEVNRKSDKKKKMELDWMHIT